MNIKVILNYALLVLISFGLMACDSDGNDLGEILTYEDIAIVFSGTTTGNVSEADGTATGTVSASSGDSIVAQTNTALTYGSFSIDSAGSWTYTLDNAAAAVQALNAGETVTESVTIASTGGNTSNITITITGVNNDAVLGGVNTGTVASNSTTPIEESLTLTDPDTDPDTFVAQTDATSTYGTFSIDEAGAWTYTLDTANTDVAALTTGSTLTDVIAVTTVDGLSDNITITITGAAANTPATFAGDITGSIDAGDTATLTGTVSVTDPDAGENVVVAQASSAQSYGSFGIGAGGAWTYVLDNSNADVAALEVGSTLTEVAAFTSADATTGSVTITINGIVATGTNKFAQIIDTMGSANGNDTGELRYALGGDGPLAAGRVEASIKRLDDTLGDGDAFLTLFNSSTNNAGAILDLRIRDSSFGVRDSAAGDTAAGGLPLTLDAFMDVVVTWEYPGGDTAVAPQVTVEVDGTSIGPFTTANSPFGGVTHVAFRFGDNGGSRPATGIVSVDDFAIYSDTAGTSEVFSDDFESYADGDSLDTDNAASPYNSSTSEATVGVEL